MEDLSPAMKRALAVIQAAGHLENTAAAQHAAGIDAGTIKALWVRGLITTEVDGYGRAVRLVAVEDA